MKVVGLSGSIVGSKTKTAMRYVMDTLKREAPEAETTFIDLAEYDLQFSDGRNYMDYEGDTKYVTTTLMEADAIIIGTPIFQASIPGTLKNIFDLLPADGLEDKVVSIVVTAGTPKHYLIAEQQLKPILTYMKAQMVPRYVFIEDTNFYRKEITDDDVLLRLERLVEDTVGMAISYQKYLEEQDAKFGF
jgi:FMN reductase